MRIPRLTRYFFLSCQENGALRVFDGVGFESDAGGVHSNSDEAARVSSDRNSVGTRNPSWQPNAGFDFDTDVPAERLIDRDSKFAVIRNVRVHYKDSFTETERNDNENDNGDENENENENAFGFGENRHRPGEPSRGGFFPPDAAVVFIHGFGAGAFSWRKIAPSLSRTLGVRCICVDRPGFGYSARPKRGEFSDDQSPYDVVEQVRPDGAFPNPGNTLFYRSW